MKKTAVLLLSFIMLLVSSFTASAKAPYSVFAEIDAGAIQSVTQLDNGCFLVEGKASVLRGGTNWTTESKVYYFTNPDGVVQWTATIIGTFYYNGTTSWCTNSTCNTSVQHGNWSEAANTPSYVGNAAFASVTMVRKVLFIVVQTENLNLTLTCDANGNVS